MHEEEKGVFDLMEGIHSQPDDPALLRTRLRSSMTTKPALFDVETLAGWNGSHPLTRRKLEPLEKKRVQERNRQLQMFRDITVAMSTTAFRQKTMEQALNEPDNLFIQDKARAFVDIHAASELGYVSRLMTTNETFQLLNEKDHNCMILRMSSTFDKEESERLHLTVGVLGVRNSARDSPVFQQRFVVIDGVGVVMFGNLNPMVKDFKELRELIDSGNTYTSFWEMLRDNGLAAGCSLLKAV